MSKTPVLRLSVLSAISAITLAACAVAPQMTDAEMEMTQTLTGSKFQPATRMMRDSIETQELFAQAAFWSHEYELNPGDLESAIKLSAAVRKLGNANRAVEIAQTTRALYPRDPYLTAEYAAGLIAAERALEAITPLDEALRYAPGLARLWSLKGAALDQQEDYDLARKYYARALEITPNDPNVMTNVGLSFALSGDPQTAEGWLRRAVSIPGASQAIRQNLALVLQLQGKNEEAEKYMGRAQHAKLQSVPPLRQASPMKGAHNSSAPPSYPPQSYQPRALAQPSNRPQANLATPATKIISSGQRNFRSASDAARAAARSTHPKRIVTPAAERTDEQTAVLNQIAGRLGPKSSQANMGQHMPQRRPQAMPQGQPIPPQHKANTGFYPAPPWVAQQTYPPLAGGALANAPQHRQPARTRR